jgi:hypothetical protein
MHRACPERSEGMGGTRHEKQQGKRLCRRHATIPSGQTPLYYILSIVPILCILCIL